MRPMYSTGQKEAGGRLGKVPGAPLRRFFTNRIGGFMPHKTVTSPFSCLHLALLNPKPETVRVTLPLSFSGPVVPKVCRCTGAEDRKARRGWI